jgi:hypothetical protein
MGSIVHYLQGAGSATPGKEANQMPRHAKTAIVAALVGALTATATAAVAGSGVGAVFNLGQANTVNQSSALAGSTANDQLDVANVNTGSSAKALGLLGKSSAAPALNAANTGGGPALGLTVNSGKSPFTVNSSTKVANLNADKLDGLDSSGFVQGGGTLFHKRLVLVKPTGWTTLVTVPGFGDLSAECTDFEGTTLAQLLFTNTTNGTLDAVWFNRGGTQEKSLTTADSNSRNAVVTGNSPYPELAVFQTGDANGRVLTLEASQRSNEPVSGKCVVMATATVQP